MNIYCLWVLQLCIETTLQKPNIVSNISTDQQAVFIQKKAEKGIHSLLAQKN